MDVPVDGKRLRAGAWGVGGLVLMLATASCWNLNNKHANTCAPTYNLGCVGDGRPYSETTPGSLPNTWCEREDYSYFSVRMAVASPRENIARCRLTIVDDSGKPVAEYTLPGGTDPEFGKDYGCSLGHTPNVLGELSYSSCYPKKATLTFHLHALSSTDEIVQEGSADGTCAPYPPEVVVGLNAEVTP